jgi:hypothetical protein
MSLKAFHVIFVTASILLALGFGGWSLKNYAEQKTVVDLVFGIASVLAAVVLVAYGRAVLKKLKHMSYL